jgi:hypothetical protein
MAGLSDLGGGNFPKKQRPVPPAGTQIGRCYAVIDLGTHMKSYQGKDPEPQHLVHFAWEFPLLPEQVFDENKGTQRLAVFKEYTASLGDKANLAKDLKSWTGLMDLSKFDIKNCLNQVGQLMVVHQKGKQAVIEKKDSLYGDGHLVYAKVNAIMPLMKGADGKYLIDVPQLKNTAIFVDLGKRFSWTEFHKCPAWIQKKIKECKEWNSVLQNFGPEPVNPNAETQAAPVATAQQTAQDHQSAFGGGAPIDSSDVPF